MFNNKIQTKTNPDLNAMVDPRKIKTMQDDLSGNVDIENVVVENANVKETGNSIMAGQAGKSIGFDSLPEISVPKKPQLFSDTPGAQQKVVADQLVKSSNNAISQPIQLPSMPTLNPANTPIDKRIVYKQNSSELRPQSRDFGPPLPNNIQRQKTLGEPATPFSNENTHQENNSNMKVNIQKEPTTGGNPVIYAFVVILVLVVFGSSGYYYWTTRMQSPAIPVDTNPDNDDKSEDKPEKVEISAGEENIIEFDENDPASVRVDIKEASEQMESWQLGTSANIVFRKKSDTNTPVTADELMNALGFTIGTNMGSVITGEVKYYLYKDVAGVRSVVIFPVKDRAQAQGLMEKNESEFASGLSNMFIVPENIPAGTTFQSSPYGNYFIRFKNFAINDSNTSIDYTFRRDELIIGTSKNALRGILDRLDR